MAGTPYPSASAKMKWTVTVFRLSVPLVKIPVPGKKLSINPDTGQELILRRGEKKTSHHRATTWYPVGVEDDVSTDTGEAVTRETEWTDSLDSQNLAHIDCSGEMQ